MRHFPKTKTHYSIFFFIVSLLITLSWLPYLQIMFHSASYGDEGIIVQSAYRIFQGQIPYRDFFSFITPGSFYLTALFMKLLGPTFLSVRISLLFTNFFIILLCCLIAYQYKVRSIGVFAVIFSFLALFGGPYWFIVSHHWTALALCLASFAAMIHAINNKLKLSFLLLAGFLAALCAFTMQHLGGVWIICASISLLFIQKPNRLKALLVFWGGVILFTLPTTILYISIVGLDTLVYDLIYFPLTRYHIAEGHHGVAIEYLGNIWEGLISTLKYRNSLEDYLRIISRGFGFVGICIVYALPYLGLFLLGLLWKMKSLATHHFVLLIAFFCSQYITAFNRMSDTSLIFAAPGALLIIAVTVNNIEIRGGVWNSATAYFKNAWIFIFSGVALFGFLFHTITGKAVTITPAGPIYSLYTGEQQTLQGLNQFFRSKDPDKIFIYPYAPMLYFLFHVNNPTAYDTLNYPSNTPDQISNVITTLEKTNCRWIIVTSQIGDDSFGEYLKRNYPTHTRLKYAVILKKKSGM